MKKTMRGTLAYAVGLAALSVGCGDAGSLEELGELSQALEVHQVTCPAGTSSSCARADFTDDADLDASDAPSINAMDGWTTKFSTSVASWPGSTLKATFRSAITRANGTSIPIELLTKDLAYDVSRGGSYAGRTGVIVDHWESGWRQAFAKNESGLGVLGSISAKQKDRYLSTHFAWDVSSWPLDNAYDLASEQSSSLPVLVTVNPGGNLAQPNSPFDVARMTVRYGTAKLTGEHPCPLTPSQTCTTTVSGLTAGTYTFNGQAGGNNRPRLRSLQRLFITNNSGTISAGNQQLPAAIDELIIGQ